MITTFKALFYEFTIFSISGSLLILHTSHCEKSYTYNSHWCTIGSTLMLCISNQFKTFEQWQSELRGVFSLQPTLWKMSSDNTICTSIAVSTQYALYYYIFSSNYVMLLPQVYENKNAPSKWISPHYHSAPNHKVISGTEVMSLAVKKGTTYILPI